MSEGVNAGLEHMHEGSVILPPFSMQIATAVSMAKEKLFAPRVHVELQLEEAESDISVAVLGTLGSGALESDAELASFVMQQRVAVELDTIWQVVEV